MRSTRAEPVLATISLLAVVWVLAVRPAAAHEVRPGFLELTETSPRSFDVLWKVPTQNGQRLRLDPVYPPGCETTSAVATSESPGALIERTTLRCAGTLTGQAVRILGLEATLTDVLLRITTLDGDAFTTRLHPASPSWIVPPTPSRAELTGTYLWLGVEHILLGIDHLLFVLGLLLLVEGRWRLLQTVTAFTIAHSITLAAATLGVVALDERAVNAAVALSILFLGVEIAHTRDGHPSPARRHPWAVAFAFGLLHGLGFASALTELGLPATAVPLALLFFNVGVELGQVGFVLLVLALLRSFDRLQVVWPAGSERLPAYAIGSMGAFWFVGRLLVLLGAGP